MISYLILSHSGLARCFCVAAGWKVWLKFGVPSGVQCHYKSLNQMIFHGLFRNALQVPNSDTCRLLVPLRYYKLTYLRSSADLESLEMTSTILWDVSTLPPITAAWGDGFSRQPSGMMTWIGFRQPCIRGKHCQWKWKIIHKGEESGHRTRNKLHPSYLHAHCSAWSPSRAVA